MGSWSACSRRLAAARGLTAKEWLLVAQLRLRLAVARVKLYVAGFERDAHLLATPADVPGAGRARPARDELERLSYLVKVAARAGILRYSCLPRSVVLVRLLRGRGAPAVLRIGVHRAGGGIAAHAWVEVDGEALGEPEGIGERFLPLAGSVTRRSAGEHAAPAGERADKP